MADSINLQQAEYDEVLQRLNAIHIEELVKIREIMKEIEELCANEGGFYVEKISLKIANLFENLDKNALATLEKAFQVSEEGIGQYMQIIKYVDTIC